MTTNTEQLRPKPTVLSADEVTHYATCCVTTEDAIRAAEQKILERALTQPAQAGETKPKWWMRETSEGIEWTDVEPWDGAWTPLYTSPPASQEQAPSDSLTIAMASVIGLASALHRVKAGNTDGAIEVITKVRNHLIAHGRWLASQEQAEPQPMLDDDGRAMIVNSHHYTADNIRAVIAQLKAFANPQETTQTDWDNLDWRGFCNVLWRLMAGLACDLPVASQEQAQQPSEPNCDRSACGDFSPGPCDHPDCHALRKQQPSGGEVVGQIVRFMNDVEAVVEFRPHQGSPLKVGDALTLATKPEPMTDEQIVQGQKVEGAQSILSFMKGVRHAEAHHGITQRADGAHQPAKEQGK